MRRGKSWRIRPAAPADAGGPAADPPLVVVAKSAGAQRLSAVDEPAAAAGLKVGMTLADARALLPTVAVAEAEPEADAALLAAIADWADRYTPLVGLDPPAGLVMDIAGCAHLFDGEAAMLADLLERMTAQGFRARGAVADTVGAAVALARFNRRRRDGAGGAGRSARAAAARGAAAAGGRHGGTRPARAEDRGRASRQAAGAAGGPFRPAPVPPARSGARARARGDQSAPADAGSLRRAALPRARRPPGGRRGGRALARRLAGRGAGAAGGGARASSPSRCSGRTGR